MNEVEASGRVIAASAEAECASSSPRRRVPLFDYRFALRVALWLCRTSWFLHRRPLPETIRRCSSPRRNAGARMPLDRAIYLIDRVCQLRVFRLAFFPRICLRRSLALYHFLGGMGHSMQLHFGVHKDGDLFEGHCWVSVDGLPLADNAPNDHFQALYSYPHHEHVETLRGSETSSSVPGTERRCGV